MKGFAGTGKTNVVMKWVYLLSGLAPESVYTAGHNKDSGETIAKSLGKEEANDIQDAIAAIPNLPEDVKLIVLDEAPGANKFDITDLADAVTLANETRKNKLKVIMLGDPNQVTANGMYSAIDDATTIEGAENITQISPLTIRYRSDVAPIVDFQDLFIDQSEDLTKTPIHTKSNVENPSSVSSSNVDLLGVNGAVADFDTEAMAILNARKNKDDGRTRAIIVNNEQEVARYKDLLAKNGITNVDVYTFVNAQGKTIDEVYQNVKFDKSFSSMKAYNTALYTAASRATKYIFAGSLPIDNSVSDTIEEIAADRAEQNKARSEKFINERNSELDIVEKFVKLPSEKDLETEVNKNNTAAENERKQAEPTEDSEGEGEADEYKEDEEKINDIVNKIVNGIPLTPEEEEYRRANAAAVEDALKEYQAIMETEVEEEGQPFDENYEDVFVEPEEEVIGADTDELSDREGNTQARTDFSDISEGTHALDNPTSQVIATVNSDGTVGEGVREGDRVLYMLRKVDDKKQVVMVVHKEDDDYTEVGVLSSEELRNPPAGFEEAYGKLLAAVEDPKAKFEKFYPAGNKVFTVLNPDMHLEANIEHAQRITYVYSRKGIPLNLEHIIDKFISTFFVRDTLKSRSNVKRTIKVYSHAEIEALEDKFDLPFTPEVGIPYLEIRGLEQKNSTVPSKMQLIRLSPAKLNMHTHGKYVTPILDFMDKVREIHAVLANIKGAEGFTYGTREFAKLTKADPDNRAELARKFGLNLGDYTANEATLRLLFNQLDRIVYDHREEPVKSKDRKKILTNYTVEFDTKVGKEENAFEGSTKVRSVKNKIATLANGMTMHIDNLYRVPAIKRYDGDAQKALHTISLSNPIIEGRIIRSFTNEKKYNAKGEVESITKKKGTLSLLSDRGGKKTITLEDLEAMFAFDEETGESTVNNGFGIRVPISKRDFPSNGKLTGDTKVEDYLLDTFDKVIPASITVALDKSAIKEREQAKTEEQKAEEPKAKTQAEQDAEDDAEYERLNAYDNAFEGNYLAKDVAEVEGLGTAIPNESVFGAVKRFAPNATTDEVRIVSDAQMLAITKGKEAWGYFKQGIIYLLEGAQGIGEKVIMHEAFHKVFAENFTQAERNRLIEAARRNVPELRTVHKEVVEEYLAEQFQNWKNKQGRISLAFTNFFKKLLNVLGLYRTNFDNIESVMKDIDNGILGTKKGEVKYEGRAMLKIREDYISTTHFRKARLDVTTTMSTLINSTALATEVVGGKQKIQVKKIELKKDYSNIKDVFPMEFDEALKELERIIINRKRIFDKKIGSGTLEGRALENAVFNQEVYGILSNDKIRKELLNSIYPSIYTGSSEFTENVEGDVATDIYNDEQKGISTDAQESDTVNYERSIGPLVKDMLATISYVEGNKLKIVNPRFAFLKLLEGFENVDTLKLSNMLSQIKEQVAAGTNPSIKAIYKKIQDLVIDTLNEYYVDHEGKRQTLTKGVEFVDTKKFTYNDGVTNITLYKKGTTEDFIRGIQTRLAKEDAGLSLEELKAHYDKMKARTTLAAIRTSIGSLRKKHIMVGVRVFENYDIDPDTGKRLRDEKGRVIVHRTTHYRYNSQRDRGATQTNRNNVENAFLKNYEKINKNFVSRLGKATKNPAKIEMINEFLELMHIPFNGGIPTNKLARTFNDIKGYAEAVLTVGKDITIEKVVEESNERIKNITSFLSRNDEKLKSVSYNAADGTKRYEWEPSSFGIDIFRHLSSDEKRRTENAANFEFLASDLFKGNIFLNEEEGAPKNKILRYVDHDGVKDKDGKFPAITYSDETSRDWFSRTFNLGFTAMLENRAVDEEGNRKYVQFTYTISNKPRAIGNEINLKTDEEIKRIIDAALVQQSNRPDLKIRGYNKDLKIFKGTREDVYKHLETIADKFAQQLVDAKFIPDYKIGELQNSLVGYVADKFVTKTKDETVEVDAMGGETYKVSIKEEHALNEKLKLSRKEYNLTKEKILPIVDLFVKNYYMNGYFMNQLMMGDQAFYKTTAEEIKRMSIAFGAGHTGMVNEEGGFTNIKYNVSVSADIENKVGEQFSKFKKFYGIKFNRTDGAAFMTPERYQNLIRGFSPEMNLGYTQKPVYSGVDKNGIPRSIKYSIIVLSDELCAAEGNEDLRNLREQLRSTLDAEGNPIGEYVFESGFKVGSPTTVTMHDKQGNRGWGTPTGEVDEDGFPIYENWQEGINPESVVQLDNRNWRVQLNPSHSVYKTISNPTQLTYFANFNGTNRAFADKLYELNSLLIDRGLNKFATKLGVTDDHKSGNFEKIRSEVTSGLGNTEARLYEFLTAKTEAVRDATGKVVEPAKPMISMNFPVAVNKAVTQLGASISKATVKIKYPGSKLVLQPDYGVKFKDKDGKMRKLKFRETYENEKGEKLEYMEVIMPNMYKDQFKHGDFLFESYMGFRIPSTEMHSSVPLKVVGFYDSKGTNVVIAPGEICAAHGSDYDIDALFIMRREAYKKANVENLLFKGEIIGYDSKGNKIENFHLKLQKRITEVARQIIAEKNKERRLELRKLHKQLDDAFDAALKNEVLDTFLEIITHPENADMMMTPISMARLNGTENSVKEEFKRLGIPVDNNFDLNDPSDQARIHRDNFAGSTLTATLADNVRGLAYGLQSFVADKASRLTYIMGLPEGRKLMNSEERSAELVKVIEGLEFGTEEFNKAIREVSDRHLEEVEKELGTTLDTPPVNEKLVIEIDDVPYNKLGREEVHSKASIAAGTHLDKDGKPFKVSETLDALINAALDNVKEQILSMINLSNNTAEAFIGMLSMQIPLFTVSKYMITPAIKEVSEHRKYAEGLGAAHTKTRAILEDLFLTGDDAIDKEELEELLVAKKVTMAELEVLAVTPFSEFTKELALLQFKVLKDFMKAQKVGSEINRITKATKIAKELPVTEEEMADKMQLFEELRTTKSDILAGMDVMRIPHIASAYNSLAKLHLIVTNNFYKHRPEINELAKDISAQIGIRLDFNENRNLRMIRDEINKFVLSSISYTADGVVHDFDTSQEEPHFYKGYKDIEKAAVGADAFNQKFIIEVEELQQGNPDNKFLSGLSTSIEFGTGMKRLVFNDATNLEPAEIIDIQDDFRKLMIDGKYTKLQRDFVKYAVLNYGLSFGATNYTLLLPVDIYKDVSKSMDDLFHFMLNKRDKATTITRLRNISQFIAIQMGVNEIDSLVQNNDFVSSTKYPESGVDGTPPNGLVHYDLKYTADKQGIIKDKVEEGEDDSQTDVEDVDDAQKDLDGIRSSEAQLTKGQRLRLPLMIKHYEKVYVRLPSYQGDKHIYYREVSRKKYSKYYRSSQKKLVDMMIYGYGLSTMFKRDAITRAVPDPNVDVYTVTKKENTKILLQGTNITLKAYDDVAQVDAVKHKILAVEFTNDEGEYVDEAVATKVHYVLTDSQKVLTLDDSKLSPEDKKDLENFC